MLKGWNINYNSAYKREKKFLIEEIDKVDRESEVIGIDVNRFMYKRDLEARLNHINKEEEVKWIQRAKEKDLLEGDAMTSYFMAKASGRYRKNRILS